MTKRERENIKEEANGDGNKKNRLKSAMGGLKEEGRKERDARAVADVRRRSSKRTRLVGGFRREKE